MVVYNTCSNENKHSPHNWTGVSNQPYYCIGEYLDISRIVTPYDNKGQEKLPGLSRVSALRDEWWGQFVAKYMEYGDGAADELGLAGQWGDLYRKIRKLKPELWYGDNTVPTRESAREVLLDIIGHAFLAVDMIDRKMTGGH